MDPTISVSKGCFVFKNGATTTKRDKKPKKKEDCTDLLGKKITSQLFYRVYQKTWKSMRNDIENIQQISYTKTIEDLIEFVENSYSDNVDNILPAAALLTGINQPDHYKQFETLSQKINEKHSANVVIIQSRDCPNLKSAIEAMVYAFVEEPLENDEDREYKKLRRGQCTMQVLQAWYQHECNENGKRTLGVIIPDFECFNAEILQDFILILSHYCNTMRIILILGVATAVSTLHSSLPYHVTSKIKLQIFQMQPASVGLNQILENVILSPRYSFRLSGKAFKFLTDIFLFYDFSINGFIQGFKYCLMEHFFQGNAFALCNKYEESLAIIPYLRHEDIEIIRRCLSFRPYVEAMTKSKQIIAILTDDEYFKKKLPKLLKNCHQFLIIFRCFMEFLTMLVDDLPKHPLGRQRREIYANCVSSNLTDLPEFKECFQMLSFMSKEEIVSKISKAIEITLHFINNDLEKDAISLECKEIVDKKIATLNDLLRKVIISGMETSTKYHAADQSHPDLKNLNRHELKEKLLLLAKQEKPISDFSRSVQNTLDYIKTEIISVHMLPFGKGSPPLLELFVFSDIASVRRNIVGAPRAALHTALNNPHFYLQCDCCELETIENMSSTLPDLSVAYKLHLECGRMINLFDWLQAFKTVVDNNDDDHEQIDPQIQARFTRAVAELQFLGYIKSSKRKTDHVTRLTW